MVNYIPPIYLTNTTHTTSTTSSLSNFDDYQFFTSIGGEAHRSPQNVADSIDPEVLWEKMYAHAKKVIVKCDHCGAHNAVSNPTCVSCGAPFQGVV